MKNFLVPLLILENGTSQVAVALQLVEARSEERDALVVTSGSEEPGPEPGNAAIAIKAQLDVRSDGGVKLTTISIKLRLGRAGGGEQVHERDIAKVHVLAGEVPVDDVLIDDVSFCDRRG